MKYYAISNQSRQNFDNLIISGVGEVFLQAAQLVLQPLVLLGKGESLLRTGSDGIGKDKNQLRF